uniref:Transthyretin-like family protein n=1 Tax=Plectus sambesii TaxID=2011161 RepID=A0A914W8C2_9BILA
MKLLLLCSFVLLCGLTSAMRKQGVGVRGKLLCGTQPLANAKVKIVDTDTGPDPDDTLDEKTTDSRGHFQLDGTTRELTDIDPVLYIWHDCYDADTPCQRKVTIKLPKKYIHSGTVENWIELGEMNMEGHFAEEDRECVH